MEFGDKTLFAVQLELDADYAGSWLFGRFCYWIDGAEVGDYSLGTSLRDVFFSMKWIVHDRGNRQGNRLCVLPAEEAFLVLDRSLYGPEETVSIAWLPEAPARFDIRPPVDVFDDCKIYLVACEDCDRILYRRNADEARIEIFNAPRGMFDIVINETYDYLEHLLEFQAS